MNAGLQQKIRAAMSAVLVTSGWLAVGLGTASAKEDDGPKKPTPGETVTLSTTNMVDRTVAPWVQTTGAAFLKRTSSSIELDGYTSTLKPDHAYTIWWVIYNHPEKCVDGDGSYRAIGCNQDEIDNAELAAKVETSMLYAGGFMTDGNGYAHFDAKMLAGNPLGQVGMGPGLLSAREAGVAFLIRDHGPAQSGKLAAQISTFGANCTVGGGTYACTEVQGGSFPLPAHP